MLCLLTLNWFLAFYFLCKFGVYIICRHTFLKILPYIFGNFCHIFNYFWTLKGSGSLVVRYAEISFLRKLCKIWIHCASCFIELSIIIKKYDVWPTTMTFSAWCLSVWLQSNVIIMIIICHLCQHKDGMIRSFSYRGCYVLLHWHVIDHSIEASLKFPTHESF